MTCFADLPPDAKKELWAVLALRHAHDIGARRARRLVESFGSAFNAVEAGLASPQAWGSLKGIPQRAADAFIGADWRTRAKAEWEAIQKHNCSFLLWTDERYPDPLRQIPDAPLLLYYKGDASLLNGPAVAVVGARNCTREGVAVSAFFSRGLTKAGVTVISGMARGIDRAAHLAGMEGAGRSIAVLGTGIDVCYPPCNTDLYGLLGSQGLLLSEFSPGTNAAATHFPVRNRLISGLSQGVLVVEAAGRSGSLITARLALEQNRDVFAVPGHTMASVSEGCRELIRLGAKAVFNADDILHELAPQLALEARKALERRLREQGKKTGAARNPADENHVKALNSAETVLPESTLPWFAETPLTADAPRGKSTGGNATLSAHTKKGLAGKRIPPLVSLPLPGASPVVPLNPDESRIVAELSSQHVHIDALAHGLDMDVSLLSSMLTVLEVRGLVRRAPGMLYSLP